MDPQTILLTVLVATAPAMLYAVCELADAVRMLVRECRREE